MPTADPPHPAVWAKLSGFATPYPLALHLVDTATVALALWDLWLRDGLRERFIEEMGPRAREIVAFTAGVHDLGKANPVFSGQLHRNPRPEDPEDKIASLRQSLREQGLPLDPGALGRTGHDPASFRRRHEQVSAWALSTDRSLPWPRGGFTAGERWLSYVALGHHGSYLSDTKGADDIAKETAFGGPWLTVRKDLTAFVHAGLQLDAEELPEKVSPALVILLTGLTVIADRLASSTARVEEAQKLIAEGRLDPSDPVAWVAARRQAMEEAVRTEVGVFTNWPDPRAQILRENAPRPLQVEAETVGDGIWAAMAPTGSGKTEAALLRHARSPERLLFLLPTQATANSLMRRLLPLFALNRAVGSLAHGQAALEEFYAAPDARVPEEEEIHPRPPQPTSAEENDGPRGLFPSEFVRSRSSRLLAAVCVGTVDQALMADLHLRWTPLRMLALANAHVVIDEAHTLDPYQGVLAKNLLWWLGEVGARVTLLSATMPTTQRNDLLDAYAHASVVTSSPKAAFAPKRPPRPAALTEAAFFPSTAARTPPRQGGSVTITPGHASAYRIGLTREVTADQVSAHVAWARRQRAGAPEGRLAIIVNTIDRAIDIATELRGGGERVLVLHSRMTAEHRRRVVQQLEDELGRTGEGKALTVVGTQAIEASLDIDVDALSTDAAPATSVIQRAGRAWRRDDPHRRERYPLADELPLHVVRAKERGWSAPYLPAVVDRCWRFLQEREHLRMPDDAQMLVETAAVSLDAGAPESDLPEPEEAQESEEAQALTDSLDELADLAYRISEATEKAIRWKEVLNPKSSPDTFSGFESKEELHTLEDGPGTRLFEHDSVRCVLLADPELVPGALELDSETVAAMPGGSTTGRLLAGATVTLTGRLARSALAEGQRVDGRGNAADGAVLLDLRSGPSTFTYDPHAGLQAQSRSGKNAGRRR